MSAVSDVGNDKESEDEMNHGVGDEHPSTSNASEMADNTITVRQSFAWLVSSSDVANEQKGKRPTEKRIKSSKMKQKMQCDASSSSFSSTDCNSKNPRNYNRGHEGNKKKRSNQGNPGLGNIRDISTQRAGFGVLPQESSTNPSASARATVCTSLPESCLPTDDKEEERNVHSL
ncbi:hypothetical protein OS493_027417 [Desmophyllum pertusum]|uniref:Uncharacterized protein n=1 Tax=Desmophyllum pertusum TaxID=174260 RepID=A0A9W9YKZ2_9CNID|nr:hypothetical protein OS493_027417 [Desmophyllum pertusum]